MPASELVRQAVTSNYQIREASNRKDQMKVLESAFAAMTADEEHILSGAGSLSNPLPYICTSRGLYFGEMRKTGMLKKTPVHVFVPREHVSRAQLVQMPGHSFTSLRAFDRDGNQVIGMAFNELSGNDLTGEAQARIVAKALGITLS